MGQNHGTPGLREMSRQRFVSFDPMPSEAPIFAYPYDDEARAVADASVRYLHEPGRIGRLRALIRLMRLRRFRLRVPGRSLLSPRRRQR
jgi:hypothetical protein